MKKFNVGFLVILVCTIFLPSINFVYAEPVPNVITPGEIIHADTDGETLNGGLIINEGGELIVDSDVTLNINGVVVVSGKITVDGTLNVNGVVVNLAEVHVRCGELVANVIGKVVREGGCNAPNEIITDLIISGGESFEIKQNKVVEILGTVIIEENGRLENAGTIENHGNIILKDGVLLNIGTIKSFCTNFNDRGINGVGVILGGGTFSETECSAPVADDDFYSVNEDEVLEITGPGVLDGDTDVDSPILTASLLTDSIFGSTMLDSDGSFTYIPNADFFGTDSFEYEVDDGTGGFDSATVTITVNSVNEKVTTTDDSYSVNEDEILKMSDLGVLLNDNDADDDVLTVSLLTGSTSGSLELNSDGSFTYTPNADFFGTDSFEYQASDGVGAVDSAIVTITVIQEIISDTTPPTITPPPAKTLETPANTTPASTGIATATDNADPSPVISYTDNDSLDSQGLGTITRTWTATDSSGNSASAEQIITIQDTTAPILNVPSDATLETPADTTPASTGIATATDNVDPSPVISSTDNDSLDSQGLGTITRTWTATDSLGNFADALQFVTLVDTTDPTIIAPPEVIIEIIGTEISQSEVELGLATATDTIDPAPTITKVVPAFFPLGETTVTWTATDASGNSADAYQNVIVISANLLLEKIGLVGELEELISEAKNKKTKDELKKAIKNLVKSTEEKKWEDDGNNLADNQGSKVFKEQLKGIKHILKILKDGKESDEFIFKLATILLGLVNIDSKIAENEYLNASNSSDAYKKCLEIAEKEFEKAEKDEAKELFDKAVKHYGKVWKNSQNADNKSCD